jgi:hypothetical protein
VDESVDPAVAALWETGVLKPLREARTALLAESEPEADRLRIAAREVSRAWTSVVAAAEAVVDDDALHEQLAGEAAALLTLANGASREDVTTLARDLAAAEARLARVFA